MGGFEYFVDAYARAGALLPPREQIGFYILWGQLRLGVLGFQAVASIDRGEATDARFAILKLHKRHAIRRVGEILEVLETAGPAQLADTLARQGAGN